MYNMDLFDRRKVTEDFIQKCGEDYFRQEHSRRSGRSTGILFYIIWQAYLNRGEWVIVKDHYNSREADKYLYMQIRRTMKDLGLYIEFSIKDDYYVRVPKSGLMSVEEAKKEGLLK